MSNADDMTPDPVGKYPVGDDEETSWPPMGSGPVLPYANDKTIVLGGKQPMGWPEAVQRTVSTICLMLLILVPLMIFWGPWGHG